MIAQLKYVVCCLWLCVLIHTPSFAVQKEVGIRSLDTLCNRYLVHVFYSNTLYRFGNDAAAIHKIYDLISNAGCKGLDRAKYHYGLLAYHEEDLEPGVVPDSIYTDALLSFCKDLYEGSVIGSYIVNDGFDPREELHADSILVQRLLSIKAADDIDMVVSSLEPPDSFYRCLMDTLKKAIEQNSIAHIHALSTALNIERWVDHFGYERYIVVNIPSATLHYYDQNKELLTSKVIVGKPTSRTPRFTAYCDQVIFYPYWNVPHNIAVEELLPRFKKDPALLDDMHMQVIAANGRVVPPGAIKWKLYSKAYFPFLLRQSTGCDNSLGVIKFDLTDPFDVYLHDTNVKRLFGSAARFFSHGCIRVEKAFELGRLLLDDKIDEAYLSSCLKAQKPTVRNVDHKVPVFVLYNTVDEVEGSLLFYKDVYHLVR
jgi:L,D-transpeptidase YcbB